MLDALYHYLPFSDFLNSGKRIYWPFLILCTFYALLFIYFTNYKIKSLKINYWLHSSSIIDVVVWIGNTIFRTTLFPLLFISSVSLASMTYQQLASNFGVQILPLFLSKHAVILYTITLFLLSDFSRFILHYACHKNAFLWKIHRMHHTAEVLTPITLYRVHPLEMILFQSRYVLVNGLTAGLFIYLFHDVITVPTIFGAECIVFISNALGGNLRHSPIPIGFGLFEKLLISPKQHQMHHSVAKEIQDSNYGAFFSIWDLLFSTWRPSKGIKNIQYGVAGHRNQSVKTLWREICLPLVGNNRFKDRKGTPWHINKIVTYSMINK